MSELIATLLGLALALLFVLLAMYVGGGNIPGDRLYRLYRLHRDVYSDSRVEAIRAAWFIWRPWS